MAIIIGSQLSFAQLNPSIDKRFGPYESIEAAYAALGPDGDDCISAGLVFGVTELDGARTYYMWTKTGTIESPVAITDRKRINVNPMVYFAGFVDGVVSISAEVGESSVTSDMVLYLKSEHRFGYLDGSSYVVNWANRHTWADGGLTPHSDVLYLDITNLALYCYNGNTLVPVSSTNADSLVLSVNGQTGVVEVNIPTKLSDLDNDLNLTKGDVGLGNVDNTPDSTKQVKSAEEDGEGNVIPETYETKSNSASLSNNTKSALEAAYDLVSIAETSGDKTALLSAFRTAIDALGSD